MPEFIRPARVTVEPGGGADWPKVVMLVALIGVGVAVSQVIGQILLVVGLVVLVVLAGAIWWLRRVLRRDRGKLSRGRGSLWGPDALRPLERPAAVEAIGPAVAAPAEPRAIGPARRSLPFTLTRLGRDEKIGR